MTAPYILIALLAPHLKLAISGTSPVPSSTPGTTDYSELPFTDPDILGCCVYQRVPGEKQTTESRLLYYYHSSTFQAVTPWPGCTPCTGARQSCSLSACECNITLFGEKLINKPV